MIGRLLKWLAAALAGAVAGIAALAAWQMTRDPAALLTRAEPVIAERVTASAIVNRAAGPRRHSDLALTTASGGTIEIALSLPGNLANQRLRVLVVLGGLPDGRRTLKLVPDDGANAVIAYQYPYDEAIRRHGSLAANLLEARKAALAVPGQVSSILGWAKAQPWAAQERVSLAGFSLGALVLPAILRALERDGIAVGPSVMAFGAAELWRLIDDKLPTDSATLRRATALLSVPALRAIEPANHLPHLKGEFLLINGTADGLMPAASIAALVALTPAPKTVVDLPAGHINQKNADLLTQVAEISRVWLYERGAINSR